MRRGQRLGLHAPRRASCGRAGRSEGSREAKALLEKACTQGDEYACPVASDPRALLDIALDIGSAIAQGAWDLTKVAGRFVLDLFFLWPLEGAVMVLRALR